ncbi:S41 family peptidase [Luteimonas sp. A537]
MRLNTLAFTLILTLALPAGAQQTPTTPIAAAERQAVVTTLASKLQANYVFPDVANTLVATLRERARAGAYADAKDNAALATLLSKDLREFGRDGHFGVRVRPDFRERPAGPRQIPGAQDVADAREEAARNGYGIESVERMSGNVGYLDLRGFWPAEFAADGFAAAMTLLSGTDALILDLRRNGGGDPAGVAQLMSHFFAVTDVRHLNDIYKRADDTTRQYWTDPTAAPRYSKPVYVLTSGRTFSGGEEAAYNFQTQKRGTLVGETTGGGANPGELYAIGHDLVAFIPNGRAINPVTKTNWEHVGVKPDVEVPAGEAKKTAHVASLRLLIAQADDAARKATLEKALAQVESGAAETVDYARRR